MSEDKGKKPEDDVKPEVPLTEEEAAAAAIVAKKAKKKKLIIMVGGAVVLLGVIVGGLTAAGVLGGGEKAEEHASKDGHGKKGVHPGDDPCLEPASGGGDKKEEVIDPCKPVYVDVPDIVVNLVSDSRRAHFANVKVTLEVKGADKVKDIENNMPRIIDAFNTYLREMTKDDLEGSEGLIRLEDEMMLRLNKILPADVVTDILFKSVIVQ